MSHQLAVDVDLAKLQSTRKALDKERLLLYEVLRAAQ